MDAAFSCAIADRFCTISITPLLSLSSCFVLSSIADIPAIDCSTFFCISSNACFVLSTCSLCFLKISFTSSIMETAFWESSIRTRMISLISFADSFDCSASFWICAATTAKPRPCSPALAASIDAFKESRFVSSAISVIILAASWILLADAFVVSVCSAIT